MPWRDWQFWVVTLAAAMGAWALLRAILPRRRAGSDASCPNCPSGSAASRPQKRRVALTIERRRMD